MVSIIASEQTEIDFDKLLRGDTDHPWKELKRIINSSKSYKGNKLFLGSTKTAQRRLQLLAVKIFGERTLDLFDSGIVPNLISEILVKKFCLEIAPATINIAIADRTASRRMGTVDSILVLYGDPKVFYRIPRYAQVTFRLHY